MLKMSDVRNDARDYEKPCKNTFLNYESPALTAELQARFQADYHRKRAFVCGSLR
jgi:hypothetical protein